MKSFPVKPEIMKPADINGFEMPAKEQPLQSVSVNAIPQNLPQRSSTFVSQTNLPPNTGAAAVSLDATHQPDWQPGDEG